MEIGALHFSSIRSSRPYERAPLSSHVDRTPFVPICSWSPLVPSDSCRASPSLHCAPSLPCSAKPEMVLRSGRGMGCVDRPTDRLRALVRVSWGALQCEATAWRGVVPCRAVLLYCYGRMPSCVYHVSLPGKGPIQPYSRHVQSIYHCHTPGLSPAIHLPYSSGVPAIYSRAILQA